MLIQSPRPRVLNGQQLRVDRVSNRSVSTLNSTLKGADSFVRSLD
jgi:hypothetical protein